MNHATYHLAPLAGAMLCALTAVPASAGGEGRHHGTGDSWIVVTGTGPNQGSRQDLRQDLRAAAPQTLLSPSAPAGVTPTAVRNHGEASSNSAEFRMQMTPAERRQLREDVSNASRNLYSPR